MSGGLARKCVRLLVAAAAAIPVVAHLVERGWSETWLVVALFALPALFARRDAKRLLVVTVALVFVVPLLPSVLRVVPFQSERVVLLGAAAWCAVADLWPRGDRVGGWVGVGRLVILGWLGWSVAGAVHGFLAQVPSGSGWMGVALSDLPRHMLVPRPQVEPTNAFAALFLRLELLLPMWFALELAARDEKVLERLVRGIAWACVLGVGMLFWDFWTGIDVRDDYFWGRLKQGIPRNNRPLVDNNALGSALVLALPLLGATVLEADWSRERRWRGGLTVVATCAAVLLLVTTRSKAALGAFALSVPTLVLVRFGARRVLSRPIPALVVFGGLGLFIGAQFLPDGVVERVASNRYGADLLRVVQLNVATDYLQANRVGPWTAALAAGEDAPLFGHGLGSLPATMSTYRDPDLETEFNPLSENGHNQWLQSFAEEGLPGALALTSLFVLASAGALHRLRALRGREQGQGEGRGQGAPWLVAAAVVAPAALALNLQVGHSLLESAVAVWTGAVLGVGVGSNTSRTTAITEALDRGRKSTWAFAAGLVVGCAPLLSVERAPLEDASYGAYPWIERDHEVLGRDRLLSTDARWFERWGDGDRMLVLMLDPRPFLFSEVLRVDVEIDGQLMLEGFPLERPTDRYMALPNTLVKVDRPVGVESGDLVEVRVRTSPVFAETFYGKSGRDWIGPRIGVPRFIRRR